MSRSRRTDPPPPDAVARPRPPDGEWGVPDSGYFALFEFHPLHATPLVTSRVSRGPRPADLSPPTTLPASGRLGSDARPELVFVMVAVDGSRPPLSFARSARPAVYFEHGRDGDPHALEAGTRAPLVDQRRIHLPDPGVPAAIVVMRITPLRERRRAAGKQRRAREAPVDCRVLGVFGLNFSGPLPPGLHLHPWLDVEAIYRSPVIQLPLSLRRFSPMNGYVEGVDAFHSSGPAAGRFDIVILSEGFTPDELPLFQQKAEIVADALLDQEPFKSELDKINIHIVRVASIDSGVERCPCTACPEGASPRTYFNVVGSFDADYPGHVGTTTPWLIWQAASAVAPPEHIEVCLVIVNCRIYGGAAYKDLPGVCFVTLPDSDVTLGRLAAHELGHAVCDFAEEYISGLGDINLRTRPNLGTQAQVDATTLPWNDLLEAGEADPATGAYRFVHDVSMDMGENGEPVFPGLPAGAVGAFWGCNYIAGENDPTAHLYEDERGRDYYRPAARCRMRRINHSFCRVCRERLREQIRLRYVP